MFLTFGQLVQHPDYIASSFEKQQKIRETWVKEELSKSENFKKLPPKAKLALATKAIYSPPSFQNKNLGEFVNEVFNKANQGDKKAKQTMENIVLGQVARDNSVITGTVDKVLVAKMFPDGHQAGRVESGFSAADVQKMGFNPRDIEGSAERRKMVSFFSDYIDKTGADTYGFNTLKVMNTILGIGMDFAVINSLVGTSVNTAKGVGKLAQFAEKAVSHGMANSRNIFFGKLVGEAAHAGITATLGVAREFAIETIKEQGEKNEDFQTILKKSSKWFGVYFAGDLVVNWATGVFFPMTKLLLTKGFKGYGDVAQVYKGLNPEKFKALTYKIFSGSDLSPDDLLGIPERVQREAISTSATFKVIKHVEQLTDEGAIQIAAQANGFNLLKLADGWRINPKIGNIIPTKVKTIKEINEYMVKNLTKKGMNPLFDSAVIEGFAKRAAGTSNVEIKTSIKGFLAEGASKDVNVLTRLAAPVGGEFKKGKLESFVKTFVKGNGAADDVIKGLRVIEDGVDLKILSKGELLLTVPKKVLKSADEAVAIKNITRRLSKLTSGKGGVPLGEDFIKLYSKSLVRQNLFTPEWMSNVVAKQDGVLLKKGNEWIINSATTGKEIQKFASIEDVGEYLIRKNVTVDMLKQSVERQGYTFNANIKESKYKILKGREILAMGDSLDEIVNQMPSVLPKMSSELGPVLSIVDDTGKLGVQVTKESIAIGSRSQLMKFFDKFQRASTGGKTFTLSGGSKGRIEFYHKRKQFEVIISDIGERRTFNQIKKAREYLEGGWKEMKAMEFAANKKGYRLEYRVGKWFLYSDIGEKLTFNSFEDVSGALKKVPMPEWAPELSGIPEELLESFVKPLDDFFLIDEIDLSDTAIDYSVRAQAGQLWVPTSSALEKLVSEGGNPEALRAFNSIEAARTFVIGREGAIRKLITTVFDNGQGKPFSKKVRTWIGQYSEATDEGMRKIIIRDALRDKVKLGKTEIEAAEKLRIFLGETDVEGAFAYFGVPREKFIKSYLPHIAERYKQNPKRVFTDGGAHSFLADVFDNKVPSEVDAFFKHSRVKDIVDISLEKDPMALLYKYTNVGLKEKYLGALIEEAKNLPSLKKDNVMRNRLFTYLRQIGGMPEGQSQKIIRSITPKILKALGVSSSLTNDLTTWTMGLGYSASMGYKGFLAVRNMNQIWTTLAMRMQGNDWVKKGLAEVAGKDGERIFNMLRSKGIIMSSLPLFGSEAISKTDKLARLTFSSLKWYKNSDDFTRAVAYMSASLKFDDALERLGRLKLKPDEFLHLSGVSQMEPQTRRQIMQLFNKGNIKGARDVFATKIVTETMFPYRSGMAPLAFSGTVGKMFGMMGHYSAYYVDNIRRSIKYMSTGEKMAAAAIMTTNSLAIYGGFRAVGIDARAFLPWEPAHFTGGPAWEIMQDMLDATGAGSEGKQARGKLFGLKKVDGKLTFNLLDAAAFKWTVPGAFEIRKMRDAVKLSNEGDSWGAFLTSTGAPYKGEWEYRAF